jgi:hypothetical protein
MFSSGKDHKEKDMTKLISLTAAAALLMISGAVAQGYNSTSPSSSTKAQQSASTSKSGASTASTSTSDKLTTKELNSAMTLDKVHDTAMLDTAKVEDRNGKVIGTVKSVEKTAAGVPEAVHIDFAPMLGTGEHVAIVTAGKAQYIPDRNIILIRMSKADVQKLPEAKS